MTPAIALPTPAEKRQAKRAANLAKRNDHIKAAFLKEYTQQPRPRTHSREYVIADLARRFFLAPETIEDLLY